MNLLVPFNLIKKHGGYFITTFLNSALPLLFLPILTRYLEPAVYANIALFNFYLFLSNSLAGTSISTMISKKFFEHSKEYLAGVIGNSIRIAFLTSLLLSVLLAVSFPLLKGLLGLPFFWIVFIPWVSFFFILFNMGLTVLRNQHKVFIFSTHKILNTLINVLISLFLVVLLLWGWQGRTWGIALSFFLSALFSFYYLHKQGYIAFSFSRQESKKILQVIVPLIPNALQSIIIAQSGVFFMQLYFTKDLLGIYSAAFQIAVSIKLLFATLAMSWSPHLYQQLANIQSINTLLLARKLILLSLFLLSGVLLVNLFSGSIITILTNSNYHGAKQFIPWFTGGFLFNGLTVFITPILIKFNKEKQLGLISLGSMALMLVANLVCIHIWGYIGIAMAFTFTSSLMFLSIAWIVQRTLPIPWAQVFNLYKK